MRWNSYWLGNVLRVIYSLSEFNNLEILWGYSDVTGVLGVTCGASGGATGWYNSLRMWHRDRWKKRGGSQAKVRIFAEPIMSSIEREGEATSIARTFVGSQVFPDSSVRDQLLEDVLWTRPVSQLQHMRSLAELHASIDLECSIGERTTDFRERLVNAASLLLNSRDAGAAISPTYVGQLQSLIEALDQFVAGENL